MENGTILSRSCTIALRVAISQKTEIKATRAGLCVNPHAGSLSDDPHVNLYMARPEKIPSGSYITKRVEHGHTCIAFVR